ncbi:MAG: porin, partial [Gammaproteobacteria bacterium]
QGFENVDLLLGRLKAPAGLEELTSSKWISTVERTVTTSDFGILSGKPDFQAQAQAHFGNFFGQLALIDEGNEDIDTKDTYSWALRAGMHFPLGEDNHFLHAAASYADRDFGDEGTIGFETEGAVHALPGDIKVQDDADFEVDDADQLGFELAYVNGPFSAQGELWSASFDGDTNGAGDISDTDVDVDSYYLLLSYFLTGESRSYKGGVGKFDKVKPKENKGAWELVAKYEDGEIDPDNQADESEFEILTLGVNWYATNNVKFMLNYLDIDTDNFDSEDGTSLDVLGEEDGNAISLRAQYAF